MLSEGLCLLYEKIVFRYLFHCQLCGVSVLSVCISVYGSTMRPLFLLDSSNNIHSFFMLQLFNIFTKLFEKHTNMPGLDPLQK